MTYASSNVQALRQAPGMQLREVRTEAGLSARTLANLMGRHPSKVSRIENGTATPSAADIRLWCLHAKAEDREGELVDQLRRLEGMFVEWQRIEKSGLRQFQGRCCVAGSMDAFSLPRVEGQIARASSVNAAATRRMGGVSMARS